MRGPRARVRARRGTGRARRRATRRSPRARCAHARSRAHPAPAPRAPRAPTAPTACSAAGRTGGRPGPTEPTDPSDRAGALQVYAPLSPYVPLTPLTPLKTLSPELTRTKTKTAPNGSARPLEATAPGDAPVTSGSSGCDGARLARLLGPDGEGEAVRKVPASPTPPGLLSPCGSSFLSPFHKSLRIVFLESFP